MFRQLKSTSFLLLVFIASASAATSSLPGGDTSPAVHEDIAASLPAIVDLSSGATPETSKGQAVSELNEEAKRGQSSAEQDTSLAKKKYKIAHCDKYGDTYCSTNLVECDSSGKIVQQAGCENYEYCDECQETCSCVKA